MKVLMLDCDGVLNTPKSNMQREHGRRPSHELDEAPSAYKDIDIVMNNQKDLVEILVELKPLGVVKG